MFLQRTNLALHDSEQHLNNSGAWNTSIESFLTQHILILLCAEMQQNIYDIVENRLLKNRDKRINRFVSESKQKMLRSVKTSDISGFLGYFGSDLKDFFNSEISEREVTTFNNAVEGRHDVAHRYGVSVTFAELQQAIIIGEKILLNVEIAINKRYKK